MIRMPTAAPSPHRYSTRRGALFAGLLYLIPVDAAASLLGRELEEIVPLGPRLEALLGTASAGAPIDPKDVGAIADYEELERRGLLRLHRHLSGDSTVRYLYELFAVLTPEGEVALAAIAARPASTSPEVSE